RGIREPEPLEQSLGTGAGVGNTRQPAEEFQILERGQAEVEQRPVAHEADRAPCQAELAPNRLAVEGQRPSVRCEHGREDPRQRGLAGAVRSPEEDDLAALEIEGSVTENRALTEAFLDAARAERHAGVSANPARRFLCEQGLEPPLEVLTDQGVRLAGE